MNTDPDKKKIRDLWIELSSRNYLDIAITIASDETIKKFDIGCFFIFTDSVKEGFSTEYEKQKLAEKLNISRDELFDYLTREYRKIFFSVAEKLLER
jgi:hypothetical protein